MSLPRTGVELIPLNFFLAAFRCISGWGLSESCSCPLEHLQPFRTWSYQAFYKQVLHPWSKASIKTLGTPRSEANLCMFGTEPLLILGILSFNHLCLYLHSFSATWGHHLSAPKAPTGSTNQDPWICLWTLTSSPSPARIISPWWGSRQSFLKWL